MKKSTGAIILSLASIATVLALPISEDSKTEETTFITTQLSVADVRDPKAIPLQDSSFRPNLPANDYFLASNGRVRYIPLQNSVVTGYLVNAKPEGSTNTDDILNDSEETLETAFQRNRVFRPIFTFRRSSSNRRRVYSRPLSNYQGDDYFPTVA